MTTTFWAADRKLSHSRTVCRKLWATRTRRWLLCRSVLNAFNPTLSKRGLRCHTDHHSYKQIQREFQSKDRDYGGLYLSPHDPVRVHADVNDVCRTFNTIFGNMSWMCAASTANSSFEASRRPVLRTPSLSYNAHECIYFRTRTHAQEWSDNCSQCHKQQYHAHTESHTTTPRTHRVKHNNATHTQSRVTDVAGHRGWVTAT